MSIQHLDVHVAAALDERGGLLGVETFTTTTAGYQRLLLWLQAFGEVDLVGVEGTGSYGAGLTRLLHADHIAVVEVDRPNRQRRRRCGKSGPQDAISAARSGQSGDSCGLAKTRADVEAVRVLRVALSSARRSRAQALNQMRALISSTPDEIRSELRDLNAHRVLQHASSYRHGQRRDVHALTRYTLRTLARRAIALEDEMTEIDKILSTLVADTAAELVAVNGVGTGVATALLVAAGENPERRRSEATFAHLCGVAPIDAGSGNRNDTASTAAATDKPTLRSGTSSSRECSATNEPAPTSPAASTKAAPRKKPCDASSATSPARSTTNSHAANSPLTAPRSIVRGWTVWGPFERRGR